MATRIWTGATDGDWSDTTNWAGGVVPVATDDVIIDNGAVDIDEGLNQSAVALNSLTIRNGYTGKIGVEDADGASASYLQVGASTVTIGEGDGDGPGLVKIDLGSTTAAAVTIHDSRSQTTDTTLPKEPPLRLKANNASTTLNVRGGKVGLATEGDATATVGTVTVERAGSGARSADVKLTNGVTVTTVTVQGGACVLDAAATTVNVLGGELRTEGSGAITTANVRGGRLVSNSTGTITTLNAYGGAIDFAASRAARTVTTLNLYASASVRIDPSVVTLTNDVNLADSKPITLTAS